MNRKLKALGLALIAVAAMAAFSVSVASASEFHSAGSHTALSGTQVGEDKFKVNAGTVTCTSANYSGTQTTATSTSIRVLPSYGGCKAFGFINATIDVNGCEYEFTAGSGSSAGVDIVCPVGKLIVVTAFNCEVTVPAQIPQGQATITNVSNHTTVVVALSGITYIQHSKEFPGCNTKGTNNEATTFFHDGTYEGHATVKGFTTEGGEIKVWYE
jgi:hypothetical protein